MTNYCEKIMSNEVKHTKNLFLAEKMEEILELFVSFSRKKFVNSKDFFLLIKKAFILLSVYFVENGIELYGEWEEELVAEINCVIYAHYSYISRKYCIGKVVLGPNKSYIVEDFENETEDQLRKLHRQWEFYIRNEFKKIGNKQEVLETIDKLFDYASEFSSLNLI